MFRAIVQNTALSTSVCDEYFQNISATNFANDVTIISSLRAFLGKRMREDDIISVFIETSSFKKVDDDDSKRILDISVKHAMFNNTLEIHGFNSIKDEENKFFMDFIDDKFCSIMNGFEKVEKITEFFKKSFRVVCFLNKERRTTYVGVEGLDLKKLHYLQCALLPMLPWYFNAEEGVSQDEMDLIQSLRDTSPDRYVACIAKIADGYNFREKAVRRMLDGFESRYLIAEKRELECKIRDTNSRINNLNDQISSSLRSLKDYQIKSIGIETKISSSAGESEIMDYVLHNKKITLQRVNDSSVIFFVKDYVSYYDKDMIETFLKNEASYIYKDGTSNYGTIPGIKMGKLIKAIFIDERLKLRFCAAYKFNINGNVIALSEFSFPYECDEYMPNPHIQRYSCLGNYSVPMNEALRDNDYVYAFDLCCASATSLNFGDSTVLHSFMSDMYSRNARRFIELPDGTSATPAEAIAYLEKEEEFEDE